MDFQSFILESIGDLVDKEMIPLYRRHVERGTEMSPQARERLAPTRPPDSAPRDEPTGARTTAHTR